MHPRFSEAELQAFETRFRQQDTWLTWTRSGEPGKESGGEHPDVLILEVALPHLATLRLTKTEDGNYLANGVPGWGLMVCPRLDELLETLAAVSGPTRQAG